MAWNLYWIANDRQNYKLDRFYYKLLSTVSPSIEVNMNFLGEHENNDMKLNGSIQKWFENSIRNEFYRVLMI